MNAQMNLRVRMAILPAILRFGRHIDLHVGVPIKK